jgi:aldehyde dehydrogenase (NAD+)
MPSQKRDVIDKAVRIMEDRKEELMDWMTKEAGSTQVKAGTEWDLTYETLRFAASFPYNITGEIYPSLVPGKESRMYRKPRGVITVISPWNFAMNLSMRSIAPALATGNAVVVKPAEDRPVTGGSIIAKIFEEAGLPEGLFNVVLGKGSDIGDYLTEHFVPEMVSFTGSTPVGKGIGVRSGERVRDVSLELDGNNVFIALDDIDVDKAVDAAIFGKFMHQGQICMATNRILVDEAVAEPFTQKFVDRVKKLKVGDPSDPETVIGPIINSKQVEKINDLIDEGIDAGAELLNDLKTEGKVIHPVVLGSVTNDMPVAQNEIFGPVAPIITFNGDKEAVDLANDTTQGLSGRCIPGMPSEG